MVVTDPDSRDCVVGGPTYTFLRSADGIVDLAGDVTVGVSTPADRAGDVTVGVPSPSDLSGEVTVGVSSPADLAGVTQCAPDCLYQCQAIAGDCGRLLLILLCCSRGWFY